MSHTDASSRGRHGIDADRLAEIRRLRDMLDRAHRMSCSDPEDPSRSTTYSASRDAIDILLSEREHVVLPLLDSVRSDVWDEGYVACLDDCEPGTRRRSRTINPYRRRARALRSSRIVEEPTP